MVHLSVCQDEPNHVPLVADIGFPLEAHLRNMPLGTQPN
jgi:hypothetical protein